MKVSRLSLGIAGLSAVSLLVLPGSASAHSWESGSMDWQTKKCARIQDKLAAAQSDYDLSDRQERRHWQRLINKSSRHDCQVNGTIVDFLAGSSQFSTLVTAVQAAGLVDTLNSGEYTVFAPTNHAFAALPAGTLDAVLADKALLTNILTYHVVPGSVDAATARSLTTATMANGKTVTIRSEGRKLYINDSRVVLYDVQTTNGIVHVIDAVLLP